MNALYSMLAGAGLMYFFDPQQGRTRRSWLRDKYVAYTNDLGEAANIVSIDFNNRMQGLKSGDLSVLVGGKNALPNPFRGGWSPTGRAILGGLGAGLFLFGLASRTPKACLLGTAGLAMIAEGITNAGFDDIRHLPQKLSRWQTHTGNGSVQRNPGEEGEEIEVTVSEGSAEYSV